MKSYLFSLQLRGSLRSRIYSGEAISPLLLTALIYIAFSILFPCTYAQDPDQSIIDASNITSWVRSDGFHPSPVRGNWYNGTYPIADSSGVVFTEGICWAGLVFDGGPQKVRVNGNNYGSGCSALTRLYRVRTDYYKADLTRDAQNFLMKPRRDITAEDLQTIRDQYERDWNEWPADKGAPYFDADKDGRYNPDIDIPGVPGALQTIWIDYNDEGLPLYASDPIGLEIQETLWAYGLQGRIGNIIYKKVDIIYRGTASTPAGSRIDSMYICQWTDTDLGNPVDDFIGTDTTLNLGYTYNSSNYDKVYSELGLVPPAVGHSFLQGVSYRTGSRSDSAIFNFRWEKGRKYFNRKPLTNSLLHRTGGYWADPAYTYTGTLEFYNLMSGYLPDPPYPGRETNREFKGYGTYMLSGDPVMGTGDIDGVYDGPGDRRYWLMNGPFNMNPGDTAEAVIVLGVGMGQDYLSSITALRHNVKGAAEYFNFFAEQMASGTLDVTAPARPNPNLPPANYVLYQNYPNPFNSFTTITYELPEQAHVKLTIYDILGREVANLVNEEKPAGQYSVQFDAGKLSSGVYIYRISFDNQSNKEVFDGLHKTMKFILIK